MFASSSARVSARALLVQVLEMETDDPAFELLEALDRVQARAHPVPRVAARPNSLAPPLGDLQDGLRVPVVRGLRMIVDSDVDPILFAQLVDRVEGAVLGLAPQGEVLADGGRERRLAVVDVADRADVDVRLRALELLLGHVRLDSCCTPASWRADPY